MPVLPTSQVFQSEALTLQLGGALPRLHVAYETWGALNAQASNAVLICHGYTSNPNAGGWWSGLIGPGKAIDTERWFVVCSNMLGSAYGSSGPPSVDPDTHRPYGPDFPAITLEDMAEAQTRLLESLGIQRLAAVIGYSFGGQLALQWATSRAARVQRVVVVASGLKTGSAPASLEAMRQRFSSLPGWNDGHFYDDADARERVNQELHALRDETLRRYGVGQYLGDTLKDEAAVDARLSEMAALWASEFDPNALITLRKANLLFDATPILDRIQAPLLYVLSRTDVLYPPSLAQPTLQVLQDARVDASYLEIDSDYGHFAPSAAWRDWGPALASFLAR